MKLTNTPSMKRKSGITPLFPASGPATGSFNGLHPKSKFLAATNLVCTLGAILTLSLGTQNSYAAVVVFTPTGGNTVSQSTSLYWDMLSNTVSTSSISGAPGNFNLSDHGDFHFTSGINQIATIPGGSDGGQTIPLGDMIDASLDWTSSGFAGTNSFGGTMVSGDTAIFGVRFEIAGQTHYGWVDITEGPTTQSINSWGYETTPNTGIFAGGAAIPEPSSLAILLGGCAIFGLRRNRKG